MLLLRDAQQVIVARAAAPVRDITMARLERLRDDLAHVFGRTGME
jgi:hypothetical protein